MPHPTFSDVFFAHRDFVSDKWVNYLDIYELFLRKYIGKQVSTLEIGVQNGGSIQIMSKYLLNAQIHGVDIDPAVLSLKLDKEAKLYCFDASNPVEIEKHLAGKDFKIIIDDGSHKNSDMINSFRALFPKLQPGGVYIIEDVQTSYWSPGFGGGLKHPNSVVEFFKEFADIANFYHIKNEMTRDDSLQEERDAYIAWIEAIHFYDNMIVITKLPKIKTKAYGRFISGNPQQAKAANDSMLVFGYESDYNKPS